MVGEFLLFAICEDERIDDDSMKDDEWMMNRAPK